LIFDAAEEILSAFPEENRIKAALAKWQTELRRDRLQDE
jgi:hypothetical protein